jgi:TolB-like protein
LPLLAQATREKLAVIPIQSVAFKSQSEELTEKVLDELFKMDLFIIREQSEVLEVLSQQGLETGCSEIICAVSAGEELKVQKVIYGSVKQGKGEYLITMALADVASGEIVKKIEHKVQGGYKDVLARDMMLATRALIGSEYTQTSIIKGDKKTEKSSSSRKKDRKQSTGK